MNLKNNPLLTGTLMLTCAGLISRGIGFLYRLFISQAFGEESMGIFQLMSPVVMIAFSLTAAGMQTAISRYTASCVALQNQEKARRYFIAGSSVCILLAAVYAVIVYGQADEIAGKLLKEERLASLLRISAFSFPLTSLHCCLNGYFYGIKEARIPAFAQLVEQLARTGSVVIIYLLLSDKGYPTIALAAWGMVFGELFSCGVSYIAYRSLVKTPTASPASFFSCFGLLGELMSMAVPLSANRLIINVLQSIEAVSIPQSLKEYGYSSETALSIYGVLMGMAFSLVLFPSAFTNSASVLLLPMVSEAASATRKKQLKKTIRRSIAGSILLGIACGLGFFLFGNWAGRILFDSILAGTFIRQLSFLCPFLYLHSTLSGILHGLKKTGISLVINVISHCISLAFAIFVIPHMGITGFFIGFLCSELFSAGCFLAAIRKSFCT